jgi:hypothetical protein
LLITPMELRKTNPAQNKALAANLVHNFHNFMGVLREPALHALASDFRDSRIANDPTAVR